MIGRMLIGAMVVTALIPGGPVNLGQPLAGIIDDARRVGCGEMVAVTPHGEVSLPAIRTEIDIDIHGILAHGSIAQMFENPTDDVLEVMYLFPLPERAAVRRMELRIGDRRIVSVVQEKVEARETYQRAKQAGKKTALLEQQRPNLLTASAANINPGEKVEVILEYVEETTWSDGRFQYQFPLTFTPRYRGEPSIGIPFRHAHSPGAPEAYFQIRLDPGFDVESVQCQSHATRIVLDKGTWVIVPESAAVPADRDILLEWRPRSDSSVESALFAEVRGDGTYALVMLVPPDREHAFDGGLVTETMFVIDVSGSMAGESIVQARDALRAALERLCPEDRFNIIRFNNGNSAFSGDFRRADAPSVAEAIGWVRALEAEGGTEIYPALLRALESFEPPSGGVVQRVIFLTDGAVGNESQLLRKILEGLGTVRLHTLGIGSAPNRYLMREMAEAGRGVCRYVSGRDISSEIDRFFGALDRPVIADLELAWTGAQAIEVYPPVLPDLHAGEPLIVSIKFSGGVPRGALTVQGRDPAGPVAMELAIGGGVPLSPGIAARWGRAKVDRLEEQWIAGGDQVEVRTAMLETALTHGLLSPVTSMVAVEHRVTAEGEVRPVRVAGTLPHGSKLLAAPLPSGGTFAPLRLLAGGLLTMAGLLISLATGLLRGAASRAGRP